MSRTVSRLLALLLVLTLVVPASMARADAPTTKDKGSRAPLGAPGIETAERPQATFSEDVAAALALKDTLSADQLKSIREILAKYEGEIAEINKGLPALQEISADRMAEPTGAKLEQMKSELATAKDLSKRLTAVQDKINADIEKVLSPEQFAQFKAGLAPAAVAKRAFDNKANGAAPDGQDATDYVASYCYTSGYYGSVASYYSYVGYVYGYYNYYYATNSSYTYYNYYYSYYGRAYTIEALTEMGPGYFDLLAHGSNYNGYLDDAMTDFYYAWYYSYYGYYYGWYDYYYGNGSSYAGTSFTYNYYGQVYNDAAYDYAYACYYN